MNTKKNIFLVLLHTDLSLYKDNLTDQVINQSSGIEKYPFEFLKNHNIIVMIDVFEPIIINKLINQPANSILTDKSQNNNLVLEHILPNGYENERLNIMQDPNLDFPNKIKNILSLNNKSYSESSIMQTSDRESFDIIKYLGEDNVSLINSQFKPGDLVSSTIADSKTITLYGKYNSLLAQKLYNLDKPLFYPQGLVAEEEVKVGSIVSFYSDNQFDNDYLKNMNIDNPTLVFVEGSTKHFEV